VRRRGVGLGVGLALASGIAVGQARVPLPVAGDSSGVLSAIRVVDLRQLCRCPIVRLDSIVRRGPRARMFEVLDQAQAFALSAADVARLRLARHQVVRSALRSMTTPARDTVLVAVQLVGPGGGSPRVLVVATPPTGVTAAYLVTLGRHRASWRVADLRSIYEP
jgi:hypothetical protein